MEPDATVDVLKMLIQDREGIPPSQQRLIHHGDQLENSRTLESYQIADKAEIWLVLKLRGGAGAPVPFADVSNAGVVNC